MLARNEVILIADYLTDKVKGDRIAEKVVYTGVIDVYYECILENLEYHSICYENEDLDIMNFQRNDAVNHLEYEPYWTRIIEHK